MKIYDDKIIEVLKESEKEAFDLHHPFIGTEHIILGILKTDNEIKDILNNNNINYNNFKKELILKTYKNNSSTNVIFTPLLKRILSNIDDNLTVSSLFIALLEEDEGIGISILNSLNIDLNALYKLVNDNYCSSESNTSDDRVIGREKEIQNIIEILCRKNKCNPLLLGEAGVGKTAIVEELSKRIKNNLVPDFLKNNKIVFVSMSSIVSGTRYRGDFEEKFEKLIKTTIDSNTILFIDEIHTIVGAGGAEGAIDASNILKPYLARNAFRCIGSSTINEYNKTIKNDKALDRRFTKIIIEEPNTTELKRILYTIKQDYENFHKVSISNKCIDHIINISSSIKDKYEPDKSIDLLDMVCSKASVNLRNKQIEKYNKELETISFNKNLYIKSNNFKNASLCKKKELYIKKKICHYKPRIDNKFIDSILTNKINVSIGF